MKSIKLISNTLILLFITISVQAQTPFINVDFNNCQIQDAGVQNISLVSGGAPACDCGLDGDALYFDGNNDYLDFDADLSQIFGNDFTISFYLNITNTVGTADILSFQKECKRDSSFTLKYIPSIRECRFDIVKSLSRSTQLNFKLDEGRCWQHIIIMRENFDYFVYLNGRLVVNDAASTDYVFSTDSKLSIANSPCLGITDTRLQGALENFRVYDEALNDLEIQGLNLFPDMILNNDTTLLSGESLQIEMGPTCASSYYWQNTQDFDNATTLEPIISPETSTTYKIFFQHIGCTSVDSISLFVQNPEDLQCDKLLLPNAFTPNGDNLNERFEISNKFIVDEIKSFDVYSRLGSRVFHGEDKHSYWDGTWQGKLLNPAKYAYVVNYTCMEQEYQKRGVVTLIR